MNLYIYIQWSATTYKPLTDEVNDTDATMVMTEATTSIMMHSPLLIVPLFSTVGVHHPAHVWVQQGPSRVQQRLHQCWWAAVHPNSNQLWRFISDLHCLCEQAAIRHTLLILHKAWFSLMHRCQQWIKTSLLFRPVTLQEKESQALEFGNSLSSSTRASASLILGIVSKARRSAPAAAKHSIWGWCQALSSLKGKYNVSPLL